MDTERNFDPDTVMEERILTFIESMAGTNPLFLRNMEQEDLTAEIPIIRTQTQSLIRFFLALTHPGRILEIGAGAGFSACFMHWCEPEARITTIEQDAERAEKATGRLTQAFRETERNAHVGLTDGILGSAMEPNDTSDKIYNVEADEEGFRVLTGDAAQILPSLLPDGGYDFVFMDAAKGQYIRYLPEVKRLMGKGAILLTDDIFKEGEILESRFAVTRRNRTIHKRMREYLRTITEDPQLQTILLQEGDGTAVSVRL